MTGDPAVQQWQQALGESTSAQLRRTQAALAASQADLTRAEQELAAARAEPCAWRGLAIDAIRERDYARAQLDDLIATLTKETS